MQRWLVALWGRRPAPFRFALLGVLLAFAKWFIEKTYGDIFYRWLVKKLAGWPAVLDAILWLAGYWYHFTFAVVFLAMVWLAVYARIDRRREAARLSVLAELQAIPRQRLGLLDYGAGIEESLEATGPATAEIAQYIARLGAIAEKYTTFTERANSRGIGWVARRNRAAETAAHFDRIALQLSPAVARFETVTAQLRNSWVPFLRVANNRTLDSVNATMAVPLLASIKTALGQVSGFRAAIHTVHDGNISQRLNESMIRLLLVADRIITVLRDTIASAEAVVERGSRG